MKYVSKGKEYNTDTAKLCARFESFFQDKTISLYRKSTGEFFLYTEYERPESGISGIRPLSYEEAKRWAYEELDLDVFYDIFVKPFEQTSKKTSFKVSISENSVEIMKTFAALSGISISEYTEKLIQEAKEKADAPRKVPKYDVCFEVAPYGYYMAATITDLVGDDIKLEATVEHLAFPHIYDLMHKGLAEKGVFDDLTEEQSEEIGSLIESVFGSTATPISGEMEEHLSTAMDSIPDVYEVLRDNLFDYWAYDTLRKDITSQARKYDIFPEEICFEDDAYTISKEQMLACKGTFYFDVLKEVAMEQQK